MPFVHTGLHLQLQRRKLRVSVGLTPTATFGPVSSPARKPGSPRAGLDPTSNNQLKAALGKKSCDQMQSYSGYCWVGHIQPNCYWTGSTDFGGVWRQATGRNQRRLPGGGAGHMSIRSRGKTQNPVEGVAGGGERERAWLDGADTGLCSQTMKC